MNIAEFSSEAGACKLVCLPVTFRLTLLGLYRGDTLLRNVLKVEPSPKHENEIMNEGVKLQKKGDCRPDRCSISEFSQVYPLSNNPPSNLSKYTKQWRSQTEHRFSTGVNAFNLEGSCRATVRCETTITLTFDLPGGHDYRMFQLKEPDGLVWEPVRVK